MDEQSYEVEVDQVRGVMAFLDFERKTHGQTTLLICDRHVAAANLNPFWMWQKKKKKKRAQKQHLPLFKDLCLEKVA